MQGIQIRNAVLSDLEKILIVQRAAFLKEAEILNDFSIAPLNQPISEVKKDMESSVILVAQNEEGEVVGSVRGRAEADGTYIFKLSVDPRFQRLGIASLLISEIEKAIPADRYYLFTRAQNRESMSLYGKKGYLVYKEELFSASIRFAYLEKIVKK
jgi:ribosomal protein S18 acetylase RimI-like enzyme